MQCYSLLNMVALTCSSVNVLLQQCYLQCFVIWVIVSHCNSTIAFFAISFSQCFAKFRKSCFASFANTSFARFRKYEFRSFTFVSQDSQGFANTSFRKLSQIQVSQAFANRFFVSQGFASFVRFSQWAVCCCDGGNSTSILPGSKSVEETRLRLQL